MEKNLLEIFPLVAQKILNHIELKSGLSLQHFEILFQNL